MSVSVLTRLRVAARHMLGNQSGIALTEFALVCPVLLLLYMGGVQVSDAIGCGRKVARTAQTIGDLTTRYAIISAAQADGILAASAQIMAPYPISQAVVRVNEITVNGSGQGKVVWSRAQGGTKRAVNSNVTLPTELQIPGVTYIYSEVQYPWSSVLTKGVMPTKTLSDSFFLLPRVSTVVACNDC